MSASPGVWDIPNEVHTVGDTPFGPITAGTRLCLLCFRRDTEATLSWCTHREALYAVGRRRVSWSRRVDHHPGGENNVKLSVETQALYEAIKDYVRAEIATQTDFDPDSLGSLREEMNLREAFGMFELDIERRIRRAIPLP